MDSHTKSYKSSTPGVPIQSLYICINRAVRPFTQTVSSGCLFSYRYILTTFKVEEYSRIDESV